MDIKTNNMTAVEWLEEQYTKQITFLHREDFEEAKEMEKQQQDEFAIGFAEWHLNISMGDDYAKFEENTTKELLEIYKKEKGL